MEAQQSSFTYDRPGNLTVLFTTNAIAPSITSQPQPSLLYSNAPVTLSVVASGARISYQWHSNGIAILGATGDSLVFSNLSGVNLTNFTVVISNATGVVTSTPAAIWADSNGNGIPDWWETQYFGNLNQTASGDYDGDGVSNLNEYREGTVPNNAGSYNPRLSIAATANGRVIATPDLPYYALNQVVTLTAIPDSGQNFLGWSGAASGTKTSISLVMSSHKSITASFGVPLPIALDGSNFVWTTGGSVPWFGQTQVTADGTNAGQSGLISNGQQSWLQTTTGNLSQNYILRFWWKVSSQAPDNASFAIDGVTITSISGESVAWQQGQFLLAPGTHTLTWTYSKDAGDNPSGIPFLDGAWVDQVALVPVLPVNALQNAGFEAPSVGSGNYQITPGGAGWVFVGNSGISGNGSGYTAANVNASEGVQVAFLQQTGAFSQIFAIAGGTYEVSFQGAQRAGYVGQTFNVTLDGQIVSSFAPPGSATAYVNYVSNPVTVTNGNHTLAFIGSNLNGGDNTIFIDNVTLLTNQRIATNPTNMLFNVSGHNLTLSWPADHTGWRLLAQTNNLGKGLSLNRNDWGTVAGSSFTNLVVIPIDSSKPAGFYQIVFP